MAEVKREHREAAHVALYGMPRDLRPGAPESGSIVSRWLVGETLSVAEQRGVDHHQRTAQIIADAEQRGRDLERLSVCGYAGAAFPNNRTVAALVKDLQRGEHTKGLSDLESEVRHG